MSYYPKGRHADGDEVDDFDEFDPTPYGGGYDIFLTFGHPLPPSEETCYPNESASLDYDYDRPHYTSYAEPSAYADDALENEYKSYSRPKPRPSGGESEYGSGYGGRPESDYGSGGYGRKPDYDRRAETEYGRRNEGDEYGSGGYGRRNEGDEYGSSGYGRRNDGDEYGSGGYGVPRPERNEYGNERAGYGKERPSYGRSEEEEENRRPSYGRSEEDEYRRPSYGRSEEDEYRKPRRDAEEDDEASSYGRKKYESFLRIESLE